MSYEVIVSFADTADKYRTYQIGDIYPREGFKPTEEWIGKLTSKNNLRGQALIRENRAAKKNKKAK